MLDPSYLRSIRDGILNGTIEANNNEALPDGLVGLYDKELFPPTMKWKERRELLHFFLVFALAQKEISTDFAAEILGDEWYNEFDENTSKEEKRLLRVNELIQLHSKRFSSAGGGKYRLYHERFRVYVLQKVSEEDIAQFNAKFIALCEKALEVQSEKDIPEKESYALEFISTHFYVSAMQGVTEYLNKEHAAALKKYAYDQQFLDRQIKASKGFEWSKSMLNQMMTWASKFNEDDEVIECALNKVDLYHQEQNDAPRILQLVADGDIETALERIEKFGGEDKEGLQRKFILYMLCLIELLYTNQTLSVENKDNVERVLKDLEMSFPKKVSYFNANRNDFSPETNTLFDAKLFFPDIIILDLIWVLSTYQFDISVFKNVTSDIDFSWIEDWSRIEFQSEKERKYLDNQKRNVSKLLKKTFNQKYPLIEKQIAISKVTQMSLKEMRKIQPIYRIEEILHCVFWSNCRISKSLESLFFSTFNQLGSRQYYFMNELSCYLSSIRNKDLWSNLSQIQFDLNGFYNNYQYYTSSFMQMCLNKLIITRVWVENRSEAIDLIYSMLENNQTSLFQFKESLIIQNLSLNEILIYLNGNFEFDESDYYAIGKCLAESGEIEDLLLLLSHKKNHNVKPIVLLGYISYRKKISPNELRLLIFYSKDYPTLLRMLISKCGYRPDGNK